MPNAVTCSVILSRVSTRVDGSLSLNFATPELSPDEKVVFMELQNQNLKMLLQPDGQELTALKDCKGEFDSKTPGQRLRAVLFVAWKQHNEPGEFEDWYRKKMEFYINDVKSTLPQA